MKRGLKRVGHAVVGKGVNRPVNDTSPMKRGLKPLTFADPLGLSNWSERHIPNEEGTETYESSNFGVRSYKSERHIPNEEGTETRELGWTKVKVVGERHIPNEEGTERLRIEKL